MIYTTGIIIPVVILQINPCARAHVPLLIASKTNYFRIIVTAVPWTFRNVDNNPQVALPAIGRLSPLARRLPISDHDVE